MGISDGVNWPGRLICLVRLGLVRHHTHFKGIIKG